MSPVFTPGGEPDVPPVFVDRFGAKAWTSHAPGGDNKVQHAVLLQAVSTVDENGQVRRARPPVAAISVPSSLFERRDRPPKHRRSTQQTRPPFFPPPPLRYSTPDIPKT